MSSYRCGSCKALLNGPDDRDGATCPRCETGRLRVVWNLTSRVLEEAERG